MKFSARPEQSPQNEETPRRPLTPYGIAKQAADQFARLYREKYGLFISVGLLYNHESPLRPPNYLSRRVAKSVAAIRKGDQKKLRLGDLQAQRDWSDARDIAQGFCLALQAPQPGDFVFASGSTRTVRDFVSAAFAAAGLDAAAHIETDPASVPTEVTVGLRGDPSKAEKVLGWKRQLEFLHHDRRHGQGRNRRPPRTPARQPRPRPPPRKCLARRRV